MKKIFKSRFIAFLLGMLVMLLLDMIFNFNNSVEKKINREFNKAQHKVEDVFK